MARDIEDEIAESLLKTKKEASRIFDSLIDDMMRIEKRKKEWQKKGAFIPAELNNQLDEVRKDVELFKSRVMKGESFDVNSLKARIDNLKHSLKLAF